MPKRKAPSDDTPTTPQTQRNTRSGKLLGETQPPQLSPRKRGRPPKKVHTQETSSLKENQEVNDLDDDDDLNISHDVAPRARIILDSAKMVTPTRRSGRRREKETGPEAPAAKVTREDSDIEDPMLLLPSNSPSKKHKVASSSPSKTTLETGTPSKSLQTNEPPSSPQRLPRILPPHLHSCLNAQKRAILAALQDPAYYGGDNEDEGDDEQPYANTASFEELSSLLTGTVDRGEGNSCLVLGPRSSGKSRVSQILARLLYHANMHPSSW